MYGWEASITAIALTLFLIFAGNGIVSTSNLYGSKSYTVDNIVALLSSISLSLSIVIIDYINSEEAFSLVALVVNVVSVFILLLVMIREKSSEKYIMYGCERAIVELSIISSLRTIVSAELGIFFALGTGVASTILMFKYTTPFLLIKKFE